MTYETTPAPKFSLTEGTYNGPQHVTITAPEGYTGGIFYTTDGSSDPTTSGIVYSSDGIDITTTTTLRAVARDSKGNFSGEAKATYTITYNAPTFSLPGGTYYGDQSVIISVEDPGTGSILYTTNGTDPKTNGKEYTEAIPLPVGTKLTLKAVAKYGEGLFSDVTVATYDIQKVSPSFYQLVTSTDELTENSSYLIVCESENVAFGKISNSKGSPQHVTITGDKIYLSAAGTGTPTEFILEVSGNNYKLKNASTGKYLNFKSSSTDITETASGTALSISFDNAKGNVKIAGATISTRQLIYRASTYNVFANYGNDNIDDSEYNKVYLYKKHIVKEFSDTEDLTASLPKTSPLADQTITLNRNVYKGWNTFCVPFKLTQAQLEEAYGSGAVAKYLSNVTTNAGDATLHFTPEAEGGIEANKAYLLYLTADVTEAKTFSGVTLQPAGTCTTTVRADNGDDYTFQGILAPTALKTDNTQYFLNSAGTYFVLPLDNTSQLKATRAYIIVPTPAGSAQGRQYSFDFNGTTTAIDNVTISGMEDGAWYTISGIRVNRPAAKGVYIHNGRKVIVK
ncbi:MAG: chitobiase/beta-hexosaminidase C-terminal domain-containing protein [Bacteroidales bacterium]|nr:chitobiase/beta-hexosaminidase C-terminal domain-containing protein [Bacteroidales bacterium]